MFTRLIDFGLLCSLVMAQNPAQVIQVTGSVKQPLNLSAQDLAKMPRTTLKVPGDK